MKILSAASTASALEEMVYAITAAAVPNLWSADHRSHVPDGPQTRPDVIISDFKGEICKKKKMKSFDFFSFQRLRFSTVFCN